MWTRQRIEKLARLWATEASASQIADLIGGTTRNAVIGKAYRLHLVKRRRGRPTKCRMALKPNQAAP